MAFSLFLILFLFPGITNAQSNAAQKEAQQRMEKTADAYFDQDDLVSAYPLYSQLLSIYPHDPKYNYRLGACMLYANGDKKKAVKYILYALKQSSSVDNLAYYYLGRAMHLNYEFDQAIRYYLKFQEVASSGELKRYPVTRLIEMCRNAKELLASSQELDVLRKKSINSSIFWEAYTMRTNGGTLITEPDEFKSKIDKKNKVVNLMYLAPGKKEAYFSSYGNNEDNGKDIYVIHKKADGTWGLPENMGSVINTSFDEDYPVYDAPRNTLYFSSKGHNSMGGYDIFSSVYNDTTQTWSDPVNLDFPINTPDDDILLVPDTSGQFAFFASARSSPQGKIEVYKIALHLHPPGTVVVAGRVSQTGTKTAVYSIVTVRDSATNRIIAVDTTSSQDGSYSFNLSKGGKYIFTVEDSAHHSQTKSVMLAAGEADRAVEQNIEMDPSGTVKIENHAAIVSPDSNSRLALQFIKNAAQMEVNVDTNSSTQTLIAQSRANNPIKQKASSAPPVANIQHAETAQSSPKESSPSKDNNTDTASITPAKNSDNNAEGSTVTQNETPANNSPGNESNKQVAVTKTNPVSEPVASQKAITDSVPDNSNMNNNQVAVTKTNPVSEPVSSQKAITDSAPDNSNVNNKQVAVTNNNPVSEPVASQKSVTDSVTDNSNVNNKQVAVTNNNPVSEPVASQKSVTDSVTDNSNVNNKQVAVTNNNSVSEPEVAQKSDMDSVPGNLEKSNSPQVAKKNNVPTETTTATNDKRTVSKSNPDVTNASNSSQSLPNAVSAHNSASPISNTDPINNTTDSIAARNSVAVVKNNPVNMPLTKIDSVKVEQLQQDEQQLNEKATGAVNYADNQIEYAEHLQKKLDALQARKKHNKDSIAILSAEVNEATQKVMDAYQLAAQYKSGAEGKQSEINKTEKGVNNANTQANNDGVGSRGGIISKGDLMRQQMKQLQDDSAQVASDNIEEIKQVNEIAQQSADFLEQARQASDTAQRSALLQQVDDLSKSKAAKQEEIDQNNTQLQQMHDQYAWLNNNAKKADSVSLASGNNNHKATTDVALQKEIDSYVAKGTNDSTITGEQGNQLAANGDANSTNRRDSISNAKHGKHSRKKKNNIAQSVAQDNTTTNSAKTNDVSNVSNTSQPVAENTQVDKNAPNDTNSELHQVVPNNNATTPPVTQEAQSNNAATPPATQEVTTNNATTSPVTQEVTANNTTTPSVAQETPSNNATTPPVVKETSVASPVPTPVGETKDYHLDSSIYYRAPNNAVLDSLANAAPVAADGDVAKESTEQMASLSISIVHYSNDMAGEKAQKSQQYFAVASQLTDAAKKTRNAAKHEPDKIKAEQLSAKADSLDALTFQLDLRGSEIVTKANTLQYSADILQLKALTSQLSDSGSDKATIAQLKLKDARDSYNKFAWERDSANKSSIPAHKQQYMEAAINDLATAIIKQQTAIYLYKQVDSMHAANAPVVAANSDNKMKAVNPDSGQNPINPPVNNAKEDNANASENSPVQDADEGKIGSAKDNSDTKQTDNIQQSTPDNSNTDATTKQPPQPDNSQPVTANKTPVTANKTPATVEPASRKAVVENNAAGESPATTDAANPVVSSRKVSDAPSPEPTPVFKPAVFSNTNTSAYSEAKPIPVDPTLPQGLIFGVQVGAFRNPITPGLFKGFEPIIGLKTPEGVVRYIAGTFKTIEPAKDAAAKIRGMGYSGAFVVAYYNGKRISIKDALAMLGGSPAASVAATSEPQQINQGSSAVTEEKPTPVVAHDNDVAANDKPPVFSGKVTSPTKRNLIDNRRRDIKAIKDSVPPAAENINDIKGLVYTVQVGSFSKRKGYSRLQKVKQLYYWAGPDGTIKYNSGVYTNLADAKAAKDIIIANTAVKDAFVTAYYKGQRISSQQAAGLLGSGVSPVPAQANNGNDGSHQAESKVEGEETDNSFAAISNDKVIYTVRIASFTGKLPVDTVNKLLTYASEGIQPHREGGGITTYYAGTLTEYELAEALRQKFLNGGFSQATVVAFYRGKKISVEEARSIKNQ